MRFQIYLMLAIALFYSCKKEQHSKSTTSIFEAGPQPYGWVKAQKNGLEFDAAVVGVRDKNNSEYFALVLWTFLDTAGLILREEIIFNKIKFLESPQEYVVSGGVNTNYNGFVGCSYTGMISDGDLVNSRYKLDESYNNILSITTIDTVDNIVNGIFNITLEINSSAEPSPDPDKIVFSEGKFESMIVF